MSYTFKHGDRPLEGITVQRAVGRGGFGEVYYALTDSGKQIALKYLRENPDIELRGIGHVMNLKSPHLITIYDVKHNPAGEPFVIMEYVSGPSLREMMLAEPNGFSVQKAAYLLSGIAKGLSYLHERGIVHRDLKPANIFYDDGYVKIGDYGLSKHISVSKHSGQTVSVGTVHYMAPEIGSGNYTKAIDIYALGVILYEMLTGRLPFSGASMGEILMRHLRDNPDLAGIPGPFARIIAKALAKTPEERYQDADEMLAAVMDTADIGQGLASFDTSALSQVPRMPEATDPERTVTTPARPAPPTMDARAVEPIGPLDERLQRKLDTFARRLEDKAAKLERKYGPGALRSTPPRVTVGYSVAHRFLSRGPQILVLGIVTIMVALLLAFWHGGPNTPARTAALAFMMIGGTAGLLLAHLRVLRRWPAQNTILERLVGAAVAGLLMMPGAGIAADEVAKADSPWVEDAEPAESPDNGFAIETDTVHVKIPWVRGVPVPPAQPKPPRLPRLFRPQNDAPPYLARMIAAPLAAFVLCDWRKRIDSGRAGRVEAKFMIAPALIGLVAANIVHAEGYTGIGAAVVAMIAFLTQSAASLWPDTVRAAPPVRPGDLSPDRPCAWPPPLVAAARQPGGAPGATASPDAPVPLDTRAAPLPSAAVENPAVRAVVINANDPSFAGHGRSGSSFLGKLLLVAGLLLVLGQPSALYYAQQACQSGEINVGPQVQEMLQHGVTPGLGLAAVGLGCLLLLIARPQAKVWTFLRRFMGSALVVAAAVIAIAAGTEPLRILFTVGADKGLDALAPDNMWGPLAMIGLLLPVGLALLWPRAGRDEPIVV